MKNFIQTGKTLALTAPADVSGGDAVLVGALFGVVVGDTTNGSTMQVTVEGVFELPKSGVTVTEGANLYWNSGASQLTTAASGNTLVAKAAEAAADSATTIKARLNG